jgi:uncharacterized protein (TIGR00645 family)
MTETSPPPLPSPHRPKPTFELTFERWLFRSRWLMAPFYVGLALALVVLLVIFCREAWHEISHVATMGPGEGIMMALSLIDLSLAGNLLVIVIFSGYENFVSKINIGDHEDRPEWMGEVTFSGLKMKLIASIVAISAIAMLRAYMRLADGENVDNHTLIWLVGMHLAFVVSGVMLAAMDWIAAKTGKH